MFGMSSSGEAIISFAIAAILLVVVAFLIRFLIAGRKKNSTVFEQVERDHEADAGGQVVKRFEDGFLSIIYGLAAAMVVADGQIDKAEVEIAERLGKRLIPNFNHEEFVKVVLAHEKLPDFSAMIDSIAPLLPLEAKSEIFQYLQAIATADGKISPDEKHYIHHAEVKFGLDRL